MSFGNQHNRPAYGGQEVTHAAVAMNGNEAARTSAAVRVADWEFMRLEFSLVLDGTGIAADDTVGFKFLASQDEGVTFKPLLKTASDDVMTIFNPAYVVTGTEITALLVEGDVGAIHVIGLTHIKVIATTDGTADADNLITVTVRNSRE